MKNGAMEVFKTDPSIKVVSSQPTSWDANKAGEITSTVLQQHPDLCAHSQRLGPADRGRRAGDQGRRQAGTRSKIFVASDGQPADCDLLEQGGFYRNLSYRADTQGEAIADAVIGAAAERRQAGNQAHRLLHRTGLGERARTTAPTASPFRRTPSNASRRRSRFRADAAS